MGLMIREARDREKGIPWEIGQRRREAGYYQTPLRRPGRLRALALREMGTTTMAFQRFGNGEERSSPGRRFIISCYCLPNLVFRPSEAKRACWLSISIRAGLVTLVGGSYAVDIST